MDHTYCISSWPVVACSRILGGSWDKASDQKKVIYVCVWARPMEGGGGVIY